MSAKTSKDAFKTFIFREIQSLLKKKGGFGKKISEKTKLFSGASGLDSLDLAELIVILEKKYGSDPFGEGRSSIRSVGDLIVYYSKRIGNKK